MHCKNNRTLSGVRSTGITRAASFTRRRSRENIDTHGNFTATFLNVQFIEMKKEKKKLFSDVLYIAVDVQLACCNTRVAPRCLV